MNNLGEKILVVEDDIQIRKFICYALETEGYKYVTEKTAKGALSALVSDRIDMMILDLGLPDFDGLDVIKRVREWSEVPIIVVSARDQDKEKVTALDVGADDYLTKPFSATELLARIRVAFRHLYKQEKISHEASHQIGNLKIEFDKHLVFLNDTELHVTPMEYNLLALLFKNAGKVLTTSYIIREIWGVGYGNDTQALRTLMAGLRRKIESEPTKPRYIMTEVGVGYRLME